jgi:hypothetical protein
VRVLDRPLPSGPGSEGDGVSVDMTGKVEALLEEDVAVVVRAEATALKSSFSFLKRRTRFHILTFSELSLAASKHSLFLSTSISSSARVGS